MTAPVIPSTGVSWRDGGFGTTDNRFYARGALAAVLVRDDRGAATDISPYKAGATNPVQYWTPFAADGQLNPNLLVSLRDPATGEWYLNPTANQGWWLIGAFDDRGGPERRPNVRHDEQMILQSTMPFASDLTAEGLSLQFTGVETLKPLMRRLRLNLPLTDASGNPIVEDAGQSNFVLSKPTDADFVPRQLLLLFARRVGGQFIYTAEAFPTNNLVDIGNFRRSKTDADAASLQFMALPSPYHTDRDPSNPTSVVPAFFSEFTAGAGWTALGGTPIFPGTAPVATAVAGTGATLVFQSVFGGAQPYTLTVASAPAEAALTVASVVPNAPTNGQTTVHLTGLTAANQDKFTITAKGTNGVSANSQQSNQITVLA